MIYQYQPEGAGGQRAGSLVDAELHELDVPEKIRSALQKEALFIALATGRCVDGLLDQD